MSQNYFKLSEIKNKTLAKLNNYWHESWIVLILPAWVAASFYIAQSVLVGVVGLLVALSIPLESVNKSVLNTVLSALLYIITLLLVAVLPIIVKTQKTDKKEIGLDRLPSWTDILITPAGLIVYLIASSLLMLLMTHLFNWIDVTQIQDTGFDHLSQYYEYILAFVTLVIVAPVIEEILFRGYLYGKLKKFLPVWVAMIITSVLFGLFHGSWALAIDTFSLSIVLCLLREITGSLWASILLHMTKNGIAFYILFINPLILTTIVK